MRPSASWAIVLKLGVASEAMRGRGIIVLVKSVKHIETKQL